MSLLFGNERSEQTVTADWYRTIILFIVASHAVRRRFHPRVPRDVDIALKPSLFPYHGRLQPRHLYVRWRPWSLHWRRSSVKLLNHRQSGLGGTLLFQISSSTHWHGPGHAPVAVVPVGRRPPQASRSGHPTLFWQLHEDTRASQPLLPDAQLFPAAKCCKLKPFLGYTRNYGDTFQKEDELFQYFLGPRYFVVRRRNTFV